MRERVTDSCRIPASFHGEGRQDESASLENKRISSFHIPSNGMQAARLQRAMSTQGSVSQRSLLRLQQDYGNQYVQRFLDAVVPVNELRRQEDENQPDYPPDWQHGAPTKPVAPDPNVHEIPDPNKVPDDGGPYRTPQPPQESSDPSTREKIAEALRKAGIPAWAAAGLIVLIIAALADPEPFTKVALLIGAAAAIIFFVAIGRQDDVPTGATASASTESTDTQGDSTDTATA